MDSLLSCHHSLLSNFNFNISKRSTRDRIWDVDSVVCLSGMKPWSLSDGNERDRKSSPKIPKMPLSDENARRLVRGRAYQLNLSRKSQGTRAKTPKWIRRTPEQMVRYLADDRDGHLYGKHVVAAIRAVRAMSESNLDDRDVRQVMSGFVGKLSFREMTLVLKEQKGWREARDFFSWMKLQLSYRPDVVVYTILLRIYGKLGKVKLAEQIFLEMLDAGCEPDEVACGTMLCCYARWGNFKAMSSFYSAIEDRRIVLPVAAYNFMLSSLQKKSLHEKVIEIWSGMIDKRVAPDDFTYTLAISSFVKLFRLNDALKAFNAMRNLCLVPGEDIYSLLISAATKDSNWDEVQRLYADMKSIGIVPSNFTYASLLTMYYKLEDYSEAISLFMSMQRQGVAADEVIYGLLIRIYGKLDLYSDAQNIFEAVNQMGLLRNEKTYLAMAQVHLMSGNSEKALHVIALMQSRNIVLSRFAYVVLLQCYVMKEDLSFAEDTFQALSNSGFPDARSCSDMLNLYKSLKLFGKAKDLIRQLRINKVDFDEELFKIVVGLFCEESMMTDLEELVEEIRENQSLTSSKFYLTFKTIHGQVGDLEKLLTVDHIDYMALQLIIKLYLANGMFCKTEQVFMSILKTSTKTSLVNQLVGVVIREGDPVKAHQLYVQVAKLGALLDDETAASLIGLYGKHQQLEKAEEVFSTFGESSKGRTLVHNAMIQAYGRCNKSEAAYELYKQSTVRGHKTSSVGISMAVTALTDHGHYQNAFSLIAKTLDDGLIPDVITYNTFIKAMLQADKLHFAATIYNHMLSYGVTPSIHTYNLMISVYGECNNLDKAEQILNAARSSGSPDEKIYMNMIKYYAKADKRQEASQLFEQMQSEGIKPGLVSYSIITRTVKGHYSKGDVENCSRQ